MPPPCVPPHRAQTLKQAKAAYKSRNQSTLTDREKKQLERSIELDRRAWRAKEMEKRKAEAKAKREEMERKERDVAVGMTSQRRCDRFGFVGSQMHLGAFFGGAGGAGGRKVGGAAVERKKGMKEEEGFEGGVDDETMMDALEDCEVETPLRKQEITKGVASKGKPSVRTSTERAPQLHSMPRPDLELFCDELDSSTQIARELDTAPSAPREAQPKSLNTSFGSGEFDLSVEDIEEAQGQDQPKARAEMDKTLMPPPALPWQPLVEPTSGNVKPTKPPSPMSRAIHPKTSVSSKLTTGRDRSIMTTSRVPSLVNVGFTLAELESFVDDELQLTQVDPV